MRHFSSYNLNKSILTICLIAFTFLLTAQDKSSDYDLSLEELSKIKLTPSFALTPVEERNIPATYTIITSEMIEMSGARSLDEVLSIFVPSMHSLNHAATSRRFVTRGLVSNDTILILVNGRVMNERVNLGAQSERFLSMLGDIDYIEVTRGPGAAIHGAGAIAGVINIKTLSGKSFDKTQVTFRQGIIEQFSSLELKHGHTFDNNNSLFFYYGIDKYQGAESDRSPFTFASDVGLYEKGTVVTDELVRHNESFRGQPRHKLHLQYDSEDFSTWLRYTKGGVMHTRANNKAFNSGVFDGGSGYQQFTFNTTYNKKLTETLKLKLSASYDTYDTVQIRDEGQLTSSDSLAHVKLAYNTNELFTHLGLTWEPNRSHALTLAYEYSYERMNMKTIGWPNIAVSSHESPWTTNMHSIITEYQWEISPKLTWFIGGRADKHSLMPWLYSPRTAFIFRPNERNTFKLIYNSSKRRPDEAAIKKFDNDDSEEIDFYEISHKYDFSEKFSSQLSAYYAVYNIINYSQTTLSTIPLGRLKYTGLDWELNYRNENWTMIFSNSFVKLINFKLNDPSLSNSISSEPQGWGNDFMESHNFITKLYLNHKFNESLYADSSLMVYWGTPGKEDYFEGLKDTDITTESYNQTSVFLNMGLTWKINERNKFRFDAHNVMGWIDSDYNKRSFRGRADYRSDAPAFTLSYAYTF